MAINNRSLDIAADIREIKEKLEINPNQAFSNKLRVVKRQGRFWALIKYVLRLETTYAKATADAFTRFANQNHNLLIQKKAAETQKNALWILASTLGLKTTNGEILKKESPSKRVIRFETLVKKTLFLSETFKSKSSQKPLPKFNYSPIKDFVLSDVNVFFEGLDKEIHEKPLKELLGFFEHNSEILDLFITIAEKTLFDDSSPSKKIMRVMCAFGGFFTDESKIQILYQTLEKNLPQGCAYDFALDDLKLRSLVRSNKPTLFASEFSKCATPNYDVLWRVVAKTGNIEIAKTLIEQGEPSWEDNVKQKKVVVDYSYSALHKLSKHGELPITTSIAELVFEKYPDLLDMQTLGSGNTPLIEAVEANNLLMVEWLLNKKADTTLQDDEGSSALQIAYKKRFKKCEELIKQASIKNQVNVGGVKG